MLNLDGLTPGAALLMEGGAMRGIFTTGVLDAFMEKGLYFQKLAAISAGSLQGLCYASHQKGRNRRINTTYCSDPRYMGMPHLFRGGSYFNFKFIFGELAHTLDPFDYDAFRESRQELFAVITDCGSGRARFVSSWSMPVESFMKVCEASCSIPLFSRPVALSGGDYVDGGVGMPLAPLPAELPFPCTKPVYILTRDMTYRKKPAPRALRWVMEARYGKTYPAIVEGMCSIPERYNERVRAVLAMEKEGKAFVIRPSRPTEVSRVEKDSKKLEALYEEGYQIGLDRIEELGEWLHEA